MEKKSVTPQRRRYDIILIVSLLILSVAILLGIRLLRRSGAYVEVEIGGETVAEYSLSQNGEYAIGEGNILVIENGEAYMSYADCPDGVCVNTGRVSFAGQSIICLPNKVSVTVRGSSDGVDLVS